MDKSLHDEIMSAVDPNPKIVFSAKDSSEDIIAYGKKKFEDFVRFYNYGTNGMSILEGNGNNNWITTPNPVENAFTILFTHHSIRLTNFQIHTGCNDNEQLAPSQFLLYGYNSHLKRWDIISDFQGQRLKMKSLYKFDVREDNQKIFYRMFRFITHTGQVSLAYIKLYGDAISESDNAPEDVACKGSTIIKYKTIPSIICQKKDKPKYLVQVYNHLFQLLWNLTNLVFTIFGIQEISHFVHVNQISQSSFVFTSLIMKSQSLATKFSLITRTALKIGALLVVKIIMMKV